MYNYDHLENCRIYIFHIFCHYMGFFLMLSSCIFFAAVSYAQEYDSPKPREMDKRILESRIAAPEPEFFVSGTSSRWKGFYFGVGFRKVGLKVADDVIILDSDGEANGIGINLGYFWDEQVIEYERQISIVQVSKNIFHDRKS